MYCVRLLRCETDMSVQYVTLPLIVLARRDLMLVEYHDNTYEPLRGLPPENQSDSAHGSKEPVKQPESVSPVYMAQQRPFRAC